MDNQSVRRRFWSASKSNTVTSSSSLAAETAPRKPSEYVFAVLGALCLIAALQWLIAVKKDNAENAPAPFDYQQASQERVAPSSLLSALGEKISTQFPEKSAATISDDLLVRASDAVAAEDDLLFAETMSMLGVSALRDDDTDAAGVYLDEALHAFELLDDELGIANVELLRGELSIKKRADARRAAYAYDAMQIARWKVAHGQFHEAIDELNYAVAENLALKRYGAAAAVYQTLYKGYVEHGQEYQAQLAGIEIVKLHASSGRPVKANEMIDTLKLKGLDDATVQQLKYDNKALQFDYENSVGQLGQARDYQQLYNHFIHAGDPVRAWQFRLKAQRSLSGVSKRAMHRAQTGVLALLYTSNDHMRSAKQSLERASALYSTNDQQTLLQDTTSLQELVY